MIITRTKIAFPNFTTRVKVASAFFTAGIKTLFGIQEFGVHSVKKMTKKEYEAFKISAVQDLARGEDVKGADFYSTLKF